MSQIDLEIKLQTERFTAIFDEAISRSEIGGYLASLLLCEDDTKFDNLKNIVSEDEFLQLKKLLSEAKLRSFPPIQREPVEITEEMIENFEEYTTIESSNELAEMVNILHGNPKIKFLAKSQLLLVPEDQASLLYLETLKRLKNRLIEKMKLSAEDKLKNEMMYRNIEKYNKSLKEKIDGLKTQLQCQEEKYQRAMDEKQEIITELETQLEMLQIDYKRNLAQILLDFEEKNNKVEEEHKSKLATLVQQDEEMEEEYNKTLKMNIKREKILRSARLEVEKELTQCLEKYDEDIGAKQSSLDILIKEFEEEKLQLEELQKKFEEQELIYIPCMAQKEAEYQEELRTKMMSLLMEHAARVIQRRWRRVLASKAEKKRLKKLGGKKKKVKD